MIFRRSERFRKISKKTFLVESLQYIIAVFNSQSVIWPKEELYHRYFMEKFLKMNGCRLLLSSPSGKCPRKHSWWSHFSIQSLLWTVSNLTQRRTLPPVVSGESFKNGWLWKAASEQSKIATCNIIQFLTINISFGIML